jgi:hypothetical protein
MADARAPSLTPAAVEHLAGRPLVLRASPRHGCCGGHALVPVAEVGPPVDPDRYQRLDDGPVVCFVERGIGPPAAAWQVDAVGFGRWRRLYLDGADTLSTPVHPDRRRTRPAP